MAIKLPNLATCKKIGLIVPSSNTAVEPITNAIFQSLNSNIIPIYTRIQVKQVGTDAKSTSQFSVETMVQAAKLLADADVDAIVWNGTSGMWVGTGLDEDRKLAQVMQDATGIPCSTTTLATVAALGELKVKNVGIAVPYTEALTAKLVEFFDSCGYNVSAATRLDETPAGNLEIARSSLDDIKKVIKRAASNGVQAVIVACTNWPGSGLAEELEKELGVVIIDSITVTDWWALRMINFKGPVPGWGKLMSDML